jgi:hypothetical protein
MEDIPSLFNNAYRKSAPIAKAVTGYDKTGIYTLNSDVFSERDFISGAVLTRVTATLEVGGFSLSRGGVDSS